MGWSRLSLQGNSRPPPPKKNVSSELLTCGRGVESPPEGVCMEQHAPHSSAASDHLACVDGAPAPAVVDQPIGFLLQVSARVPSDHWQQQEKVRWKHINLCSQVGEKALLPMHTLKEV